MEDLLQNTLQTIVITIIQVMAPIIAGLVIRLFLLQISKIKASLTSEEYEFASKLAKQLVLAAEQNGLKDQFLAEGSAKKEYVLSHMEALLKSKGIKLNIRMISDIVEAAVFDELTRVKASPDTLPTTREPVTDESLSIAVSD